MDAAALLLYAVYKRDRQSPVDGAVGRRLPRRVSIRTDRSCDMLYHVAMLSRLAAGSQVRSTLLAFGSRAFRGLARQSDRILDGAHG